MNTPVGIRIKTLGHWFNPPLIEYRTVDIDNEPVVDGEIVACPDLLTMTGAQILAHVAADAVTKGILPPAE